MVIAPSAQPSLHLAGFCGCPAGNAIIAVNDAFERLSGYAESDIIGQNCRLLSGAGTCPTSRALLRQAIEAGRPALVTLINYRKDGQAFHNAVMIAPVYDESGCLAFFIGTQLKVDGEVQDSGIARARSADLTPQQLKVLEQMARGMRHAEIAKSLCLSIKTVKMHRGALVQRLGVQTSTEAIRIAIEAGL
ncbi:MULTISPECIES: PAS domain-containing protein [unclassified Sphingobium]|uniref:PAS domain-containing protein n=1 Tax=unclassified Sphingobium TaxID=2611147 RepID=UPI000D15DC10|nr:MULTISPECIES: PAS domain-containing protein [unclassified Sphingobium]MBG6119831.1 PAS domain S-box-containing protein [Sphingobium sp. JAI105]PSO11301.1 histidine kinase [Sphingobium sp. AEW4]